ncbi:hypothetical protein [Winogradskyella flava]|uniref:hypothetical protein n=1 Tax=Winogradskyella flava TaxID=1884876 RepID=UPI0024931B7A|nr:hypothetical protein [Winogradskyella flava]
MKNALIILGFLSAIIATIFSTTHLFQFAIIPIALAFLAGVSLLIIGKNSKIKTIQYIFLLVIISLSLTIYKGIFSTTEIGNSGQLEQQDERHSEDSEKIL